MGLTKSHAEEQLAEARKGLEQAETYGRIWDVKDARMDVRVAEEQLRKAGG